MPMRTILPLTMVALILTPRDASTGQSDAASSAAIPAAQAKPAAQVAVSAEANPAEITVTKDTVFTFYRQFDRLTAHPRGVAPMTAMLCRAPNLIESEKRSADAHYHSTIHIYANPAAAAAILHRSNAFPTGSIVVKEKLAKEGDVTGVGGMIKRAPGFDPSNGDWEYFYAEPQGADFSIGRLENCSACHARAKETGYVFCTLKTLGAD